MGLCSEYMTGFFIVALFDTDEDDEKREKK